MTKKAQGLSLRTIIVAILVLIVLAVTIFIFSGKIGDVRGGFNSCEDQGGQCTTNCDGPTLKVGSCETCCLKLGTDST